jgi:hypothetical protein
MEQTKIDSLTLFKKEFKELFKQNTKNGKWLKLPTIPKEDKKETKSFVENSKDIKLEETHIQNDPEQLEIRLETGKLAEFSFSNFLKSKNISVRKPNTKISHSYEHDYPDIEINGGQYGIKASVFGNAALIPLKPKYDEIIIVRLWDEFYVAGIATIEIQKKYKDKSLFKYGTKGQVKAGLTIEGYKRLNSFTNLLSLLHL